MKPTVIAAKTICTAQSPLTVIEFCAVQAVAGCIVMSAKVMRIDT